MKSAVKLEGGREGCVKIESFVHVVKLLVRY